MVFSWCLGFLHMFNVLTVNAYVQLGLLIVKCLLDYTYLSRQTYRPFASALNYFFLSSACLILHFCFVCSSATSASLWYFELVTYLRPHFCANGVYMAVGCIWMQLICLLSKSSPCWQPSYPFGSKQEEGIESKSMLCVHHSHHWGQ